MIVSRIHPNTIKFVMPPDNPHWQQIVSLYRLVDAVVIGTDLIDKALAVEDVATLRRDIDLHRELLALAYQDADAALVHVSTVLLGQLKRTP